jgi:hypothetical protein
MVTKAEVREIESAPLDQMPLINTVVITRDPMIPSSNITMLPPEREMLRLLEEHFGAWEKHRHTPTKEARRMSDVEWGFVQAMLVALDLTVITMDAQNRLVAWTQKLQAL